MNGPVFDGVHDRLDEYQLDLHRSHLKRQSDAELRRSYNTYLRPLALKESGAVPRALMVQYFIETWREMRRRQFAAFNARSAETPR